MLHKIITIICLLIPFLGGAQELKDYPTNAHKLEVAELDRIINSPKGKSIQMHINVDEIITATINMNVDNDANNKTIGAALKGIEKTFLTLNRYTNKGKIIYSGDIISHDRENAYKIYTSADGVIYIEQISKESLITE